AAVAGFIKPADQPITIQFNQTASISAAYIPETGSVQVTLSPQAAADEGTRWRIDQGVWQTSGQTLTGISVGSHTIEFSAIDGWITPSSQIVNIVYNQNTQLMGTYRRQTGSVQVTLAPQAAIDSGA